MRFLPIIFIFFIAACSGDRNDTGRSRFLPPAIENTVVCETSGFLSHQRIIELLDSLDALGITVICVEPPVQGQHAIFQALVDSSHERGIAVLIHANGITGIDTALVRRFDVDGFHCMNAFTANNDAWNARLDMLSSVKPLLIMADSINPGLYDAGFTSFRSTAYERTLSAVLGGGHANLLDSLLAYEQRTYPRGTRLVRSGQPLSSTHVTPAMRQTLYTTALALPGVPFVAYDDLSRHAEFFGTIHVLFHNSPALQYGTLESQRAEAMSDVYVAVRNYENERVLIAVNFRGKPAPYKWPTNLERSKTEWLAGEPLTSSGGQTLPPYGFQILRFGYIEGMQPLELDYK